MNDRFRPPGAVNVLGTPLATCSADPLTGFFRDGCCHSSPEDAGRHLVCAELTAEFLAFSREQGNDLVTPRPEFEFPGLRPGDRWCLCAMRWEEARRAGVAPPVVLEATHAAATQLIPLDVLRRHARGSSAAP